MNKNENLNNYIDNSNIIRCIIKCFVNIERINNTFESLNELKFNLLL